MEMKSSAVPSRPPRLSILIPSEGDPRARAGYIASWARQDHPDPLDYEIIVLGDDIPAPVAAEIRSHLRPHDQLVTQADQTRSLYDHAAALARGSLLLMTEDHVVARPWAVHEILEFFDTHEENAAVITCGHINQTAVARLEQGLFERSQHLWHTASTWNHVRIRGFAICKSLYQEMGGYPRSYDHFSEALLAARLNAANHTIGEVPRECLRHANTTTFPEISRHIDNYVRGRCQYHEEADIDANSLLGQRYFPPPAEWSRYRNFSTRTALQDIGALLQVLLRPPRTLSGLKAHVRLGWAALARLVDCCLGPRRACLLSGIRASGIELALRAAIACGRLRIDWAHLLWHELERYHQLRYLVRTAGQPRRNSGTEPVGAPRLLDFHPPETHEGKTFRWSSPVAAVLLSVRAGEWQITLDTGGIRADLETALLGLFWNGRRVPRSSVEICGGCIRFVVSSQEMTSDRPQRLTLIAKPSIPARQTGDARWLGLPLQSIRVKPMAEATTPQPVWKAA